MGVYVQNASWEPEGGDPFPSLIVFNNYSFSVTVRGWRRERGRRSRGYRRAVAT
jgi:hypothetical protein